MHHKNYVLAMLLTLLSSFLQRVNAQNDAILGQVVDAKTDLPVAFANVVFDKAAGTITDIDGRFEIPKGNTVSFLQFSCLGYHPMQLDAADITPFVYVKMEPVQYQLGEIDVMPGENPALPIMRKVIENSDRHNPSLYNPFSCIVYHKMIVEYDLPETIKSEELPVLMAELGLSPDSYLLLFESVTEKRHYKAGVGKERVLSGRVSGMKNSTLASLPAMLQPFSFYDKYVKVLDQEYLNPASKPGLQAYTFQLLDTLVDAAGDTAYYISFRPKNNKNFRGLTGSFHIQLPDYAIKTVSSKTTGTERGLSLFIRQNYAPNADGLWFPKQLESSLAFGSLGAANELPHPLLGSGKSYVTAINTTPDFDASDYDNVVFEDESMAREASGIGLYRYEPLTARDSLTYHLLDSIGRRAHLDAIINLQLSLVKGYIPVGKFKLDLRRFIDYNDFEGLKLGMGLYTGPKWSEKYSIGGYATYGLADKEWKYGTSLEVTPFKREDNRFVFSYKDDVFATGAFSFLDGIKVNSSEMFRGYLTETMDRTQELRTGAEFRVARYFKIGSYYRMADVSPQKAYRFMDDPSIQPGFDFMEGELKIKWAHKETFTKTALGLLSEGTKWPVLWLNAAYGEGKMEESFTYQKLEAQLEHTFRYPSAMYTTIRLQGGELFGDYPSTFLYSSLGAYKRLTILVPNSFATMRMNEFATNEFGAVYFTHGIPLGLNSNRRVKPEIVLLSNAAWGKGPSGVRSFEKGYYESGLYLKGLYTSFIFKYGLSVHYRYGAYQMSNAIDNWAFKLGLEFSL